MSRFSLVALLALAHCTSPNPDAQDLSASPSDLAADLPPAPDLAVPDLSASTDLAGSRDLTSATDLTSARDMTSPLDMTSPRDMTSPDLLSPRDMTSPDIASPRDMASPPDLLSPRDMAGQSVTCGLLTCSLGQSCCGDVNNLPAVTCTANCPAGSTINALCDGPEDCGGAAPYCCGTLRVGAGVPPQCPLNGVSASCTATCQTNLAPTCSMTASVRACHRGADCASDPQNANCCEFIQSGVTLSFCVNDLFKGIANRCFP